MLRKMKKWPKTLGYHIGVRRHMRIMRRHRRKGLQYVALKPLQEVSMPFVAVPLSSMFASVLV